MKVVIDTNVVVSALKSNRGASYDLISALPSKQFQPVLSVPLYLEYQDVLARPECTSGCSSREELLNFLRYLCSICDRQDIFFLWRPWLKDPKDDMVLELAVASSSRYIITYNVSDFKRIHGFSVEAITPREFIEILRGMQ